MNALKKMWFSNKPLLISLLVFSLLLIRIIFSSVYMFSNLHTVSGTIQKMDLSKDGSKTYLTLSLRNDSNIYYQRYKKRFFDKKVLVLNNGQKINFYTSNNRLYSAPALWNDRQHTGYYYYPVFNINTSKSIVDVLLFNFYSLNLINFLFYISILSTLLYSFFYIVHSKGVFRVLFLVILVFVVWLWFP